MKKLSLSILLMGVVCSHAFGQAARFDSVAQTTTTVSATNTTVLVPLPGATVTVLNYPANGLPGTNKASVCPDSTLVGCTTGAPNNPITADARGNFGFWIAAGTYDYTVCAPSGVCQGPYHIVLGSSQASGTFTVDGTIYTTIQAAITAAGATGYVIIPSNYAGVDDYTNPNAIQIDDRRAKPDRDFGYINAMTVCGLQGAGVSGTNDEGAAINTCLNTWGLLGRTLFFPRTSSTQTGCDYYSTVTLVPYGSIRGAGSTWPNNGPAQQTNTNICFSSGVTGMDYELVQCRGSCFLEHIGLIGGDYFGNLTTPTKFILPMGSALTRWKRTLSTIQRAGNVVTATANRINGVGEGLTQQVGSTIKITGVAGDATLNGLCIITTLSNGGFSGSDNFRTFTCTQNGADTGPYSSDGSVILPTTGTAISDGIRVCGNFYLFNHISVMGFARWGINGDANSGEGCQFLFADDLTVRDSIITNNQVGGFFTRGTDSSVDLFSGNSFYYNGWAIVDASALGNTYINNNVSNNGSQWAVGTTPATKTISTISRTLSGNDSVVTVVLSQADTTLKQGACVVIAGASDTSFNTATPPAGTATQCFFITTFTDSTHFQYIQPGAPANASSSGGTSRYAKFSETYLSSGIDSGGANVGIGESASADSLLLNNYTEGGQTNKFGSSIMVIQGANGAGSGSFQPTLLSTQYFAAGTGGTTMTDFGNRSDEVAGYEMTLHAGATSNANTNHIYISWDTFDNQRAWRLDTQTKSGSQSWQLSRSASGRRLYFDQTLTRIDSEGSGAVEVNKNGGQGSGTTGLEVWSGGASPQYYAKFNASGITVGDGAGATVATISNAGLGTFVGVKSSGPISPTVAGAQTAGTNALPFSSVYVGAAATNNSQITGTFTAARVHTLPDITGNVSVYLSASDAAVDLASVATAACSAERTVAVTGAAFGDAVDVMAGTALEAGGFLTGKVTSAGNTKWQLCNLSGGAIDRASDTYTIRVRK